MMGDFNTVLPETHNLKHIYETDIIMPILDSGGLNTGIISSFGKI